MQEFAASNPYLITIAAALGAAVIALVVAQVVHLVVVRWGRRSRLLAELSEHSRQPFRVALTVLAVQLAVRFSTGYAVGTPLRRTVLHVLVLAVIASIAWVVASLLLVAEDLALERFRTDVPDNREARRIKTQVLILRRVTIAAIVVLTIGAMLMTLPGVRGVGASVLASAGVIGAIAALAAQSVLGNVFAGLQLAFSDAVRLDDVVVVEGEWGRVEELTLSYAVVHIWDDRRLILPTSYFTTKPFQNWTRNQAAVLGTAEIDVDWDVQVPALREELRRLVESSELWDGRACSLQVTDATGGSIKLRAVVSAANAGSLWDLRCLVREHLVAWVRDHRPIAIPRLRAELGRAEETRTEDGRAEDPRRSGPRPPADTQEDDARVFGGSVDGEARSAAFVGPDEHVRSDDEPRSVRPPGVAGDGDRDGAAADSRDGLVRAGGSAGAAGSTSRG